MLHFVQHDKQLHAELSLCVIPSDSEESTHGCFTSFSMTSWWMLHFVQHDKQLHAELSLCVIPSNSEESTHGCFTSFSMTSWWMLHFVQHDSASARHWGIIGSIRTLFKACIHLITKFTNCNLSRLPHHHAPLATLQRMWHPCLYLQILPIPARHAVRQFA